MQPMTSNVAKAIIWEEGAISSSMKFVSMELNIIFVGNRLHSETPKQNFLSFKINFGHVYS